VIAAAVTGSAAVRAAGRSPHAPAASAAAIQRTFVSTAGSDANPCTAAQPCRNFAAAIANTSPGGEVVALESGGYGTFTVDKPLTIAGAPGEHVAVTVFSGTGIAVAGGATDTVILRNLYLKGLGGQTGIAFTAGGALYLDRVTIVGFNGDGLSATAADAKLVVQDSSFRANGARGFSVGGSLTVEVADSRADANGQLGSGSGFRMAGGARGSFTRCSATGNSAAGFEVRTDAVVSIFGSLADRNDNGVLEFDAPSTGGTQVNIANSVLSNNVAGLRTATEGVARIGASLVTGNGVGLVNPDGTLESYGDNMVRGNTTATSGIVTVVGKT